MSGDLPETLPPAVKAWLIECRLTGIDPHVVGTILLQKGYSPDLYCDDMLFTPNDTPLLEAGKHLADEAKRLEWLLRVYEYNASLMPDATSVPRCKNLKRDEFLTRFYAAGRPVILTDFVRRWPAFKRWEDTYLTQRCGDLMMEYTKTHPGKDTLCKTHEQMNFGEFLQLRRGLEATNDFYMTSYNNVANTPIVERLIPDLTPVPDYLDKSGMTPDKVFPWIGPAGTHTGLHIDSANALLCQIRGRKQIFLVAPHHMPHLYLDNDFFSPVNLHAPDHQRFPKSRYAKVIEVTLHPGEALFLPTGWWHQVLALDPSISVTLTNFVFPNNYPPISSVFPTVAHKPGNSIPQQEPAE